MRYRGLDGLRATAAVLVICEHWIAPGTPYKAWIPGPGLGITLFFVLSGFLITEILLREREAIERGTMTRTEGAIRFYTARVFRILPLYFVGIALLWGWNVAETRQYGPWVLTFSENLYPSFHNGFMGFIGHYWTLAIEWKFYIAWGALLLLIPRRHALVVIVLPIVLAPIWRMHAGRWIGLPYTSLWVPGAMDALAIGGALALVRSRPRTTLDMKMMTWLCLLFGGSIVVATYINRATGVGLAPIVWRLSGTGTALLAAAIVQICANRSRPIPILDARPIAWLGRISFGLYVYHLVLLGALPEILQSVGLHQHLFSYYNTWWFRGATTLIVASASWSFVERPCIDFGRRLSQALCARFSSRTELA